MADEQEQKYITYKDDKAEYNRQCYNTWKVWFDKHKSRIRENHELFNNYSRDLAERKKDDTLSRACVFISMVQPAVLARAAYMTNMLYSVDEPIEVTPRYGTPPEVAENIRLTLDDDLEKDNFQDTWLRKNIAQEILPISFLRVCEFEEEEKVLKLNPEQTAIEGAPQFKANLGTFKNWESEKTEWRPTIELYTQESVFYEPEPKKWEDKTYVGLIVPLTLAELVARKQTRGYKFNVEKLKKDGDYMDEQSEFGDVLQSDVKREQKGTTASHKKRFRVLVNYHIVEKPDGTTQVKITTTCGKVKLLDEDFPYERLKITDLFIPIIGYPILNRVEGNTTTDNMKYIQHTVNDFFNILLDFAKYSLFPPRLRDSRATILSEQKIGPGTEWEVDMNWAPPNVGLKDVVTHIFESTPVGREFFELITVLFDRAETVSGTPEDVLMGGTSDPEEKATKTTLRAAGAKSRLAGISLMQDVQTIKKLAYVLWTMRLERLSYGEKYTIGKQGETELDLEAINGRVAFGVPHLEGLAQKEAKRARLDKLFADIAALPIAQRPEMLDVFYTLLKKRAELDLISDFDEILPYEIIAMIKQNLMAEQQVQQEAEKIKAVTGGKGGNPQEAILNQFLGGS